MEILGVKIKMSPTGMYSTWHLEIARKYDVRLMITSDTGHFAKIGNDVYKVTHPHDIYKLYSYIATLDEMKKEGDVTDEEASKEIDSIFNNENKDFIVEKCTPLDEWEEHIKELSKK